MTAMEIRPKVIGTSVKRKEDASLLRGKGTFVDNLTLPGTGTWPSFAARIRTHESTA